MTLKSLALTIPPLRRLYEHRNALLQQVQALEADKQALTTQMQAIQHEAETRFAATQHLWEGIAARLDAQTEQSAQHFDALTERQQQQEEREATLAERSESLSQAMAAMEEHAAKLARRLFRSGVEAPYWNVSLEAEIQHLHRKVNSLMQRIPAARARIRCLFVVHFANNWTALEPIYKAMAAADDFEPFVVVVDYSFYGRDDFITCDALSDMLNARGIPHFKWRDMKDYEPGTNAGQFLLHHLDPDIVFRQAPYDGSVPPPLWVFNSSAYRTCYVPYGLETVQTPASTVNTEFFYSAWRIYACAEKQAQYFLEESLVGGTNVRVVGNPRLDMIAERCAREPRGERPFTVLWTPHHSAGAHWLSFATFHQNCWDILRFADEQRDIAFILRGHHILFKTMIDLGAMTPDSIETFRTKWSALPNTRIDESACFSDVFVQSDVMLGDGVSFLTEYQVTGKPVIFIERPDHVAFNVFGQSTIPGTYRVANAEEAFARILDLKAGGDDPLAAARQTSAALMRPFPGQAAERILDDIRAGISDG